MSVYRDGAAPPRFLCGVCWRTASPAPGGCCGVPLQPLENNDALLAELRRRARRRQERPARRRLAFVAGGAMAGALTLHAVLLGTGVYDVKPARGGWQHGGAAAILLYVTLTFLALVVVLASVARGIFLPPRDPIDPDTAAPDTLLRILDER